MPPRNCTQALMHVMLMIPPHTCLPYHISNKCCYWGCMLLHPDHSIDQLRLVKPTLLRTKQLLFKTNTDSTHSGPVHSTFTAGIPPHSSAAKKGPSHRLAEHPAPGCQLVVPVTKITYASRLLGPTTPYACPRRHAPWVYACVSHPRWERKDR